MNLLRIEKSFDGLPKDEAEAHEKDETGDQPPEKAIATIPIGELAGATLRRETIEVPGQPQRKRVSEIVDRIRKNRDAVGPDSPDDFDDREREVQKKGDFQIVAASMVMIVGHAVDRVKRR
jgi:hypothetical protein